MKDKGKKSGEIYIALGNRILRIAFVMIKEQQLYKSSQPEYLLDKVIAGKLRNAKKQEIFYQRYVKV